MEFDLGRFFVFEVVEVCYEGEDDEGGLCGMVWYGMVFYCFLFFSLFFSFLCIRSMGLVGNVAMRGRGRGRGREREKREQAESRHVYFYHQSSIFSSAYP